MNIGCDLWSVDVSPAASVTSRTGQSDGLVGEPEITPVSAAIASHLGIDLSMEGKASRNRRGIAIVVHGAPLSGNSLRAVVG